MTSSLSLNSDKIDLLLIVSPQTLAEIKLTDATDDFDFVTADDGDFTFRALDGRTRTDTWLSNHEELALGTDPYNPDHDDDFDALFRKVCRLRDVPEAEQVEFSKRLPFDYRTKRNEADIRYWL